MGKFFDFFLPVWVKKTLTHESLINLSGLSVYLQLVTDDTNGATGQWLGSLLETVTIQ